MAPDNFNQQQLAPPSSDYWETSFHNQNVLFNQGRILEANLRELRKKQDAAFNYLWGQVINGQAVENEAMENFEKEIRQITEDTRSSLAQIT